MIRLIALSVFVAAVGACGTQPQQGSATPATPKVVTNVHPYTPGEGTITAVMPAPSSAAAGGSAEPLQRLEIRMDNGKVQYVDVPSKDFPKGTRVTLTQDKLISKGK
jgi:hypothetical protein